MRAFLKQSWSQLEFFFHISSFPEVARLLPWVRHPPPVKYPAGQGALKRAALSPWTAEQACKSPRTATSPPEAKPCWACTGWEASSPPGAKPCQTIKSQWAASSPSGAQPCQTWWWPKEEEEAMCSKTPNLDWKLKKSIFLEAQPWFLKAWHPKISKKNPQN